MQSDSPIVSIIVIGYNGIAYLDDCLNSILDQAYPQEKYEILYVDNHSSDGSAHFVSVQFPQIKVIELVENIGYYRAFNTVCESQSKGKYLIPLPQDTIVHRQWLAELVYAADNNPDAVICLVNTIFPTVPDYAGLDREDWPQYTYLLSTARTGQSMLVRWPFTQQPTRILAYSGVSALIKREIRSRTGYFFDTELSHFLGDVEIGLRASVLGYDVLLVPTAIVYHVDDNKRWTNIQLIKRALHGARDNFVVYYITMHTFEFVLFLPLLLVGIPMKTFTLRISVIKKVLFFVFALMMSPFACLLALISFPRHAEKRKRLLLMRKNSYFWLLKTILKRERL